MINESSHEEVLRDALIPQDEFQERFNISFDDNSASSVTNTTLSGPDEATLSEMNSVKDLYAHFVPILIAACSVTFCMNLVIILAFPFVRRLSRVTRPYVTFILSLVVSDALASFLLGFQLVLSSYIGVVAGVAVNVCLGMAVEVLRLAAIVVTVYHLLVMVSIHLAGIQNPIKFKEVVTLRSTRFTILLLWAVPLTLILIPFCAIPGQGFRSQGCQEHSFLAKMPFRAVFSASIVAPTAAIVVLYVWFHCVLWHSRDVSRDSVSRQNLRAARVTVLIVFTCTLGWMPAVVNSLIMCADGCAMTHADFKPRTLFAINAVAYILIVFKSFANPLIFAFRQANIRDAVRRLFRRLVCCETGASEADSAGPNGNAHYRTPSRTSSVTSHYRSSNRDRDRLRGSGHGDFARRSNGHGPGHGLGLATHTEEPEEHDEHQVMISTGE